MRIPASIAAVAVALQLAAGPAAAQTEAARLTSEDAVMMFSELCILTRGDAARIDATITRQRIQAAPLSEEGVQTLLEGKSGDKGWLIHTERGTVLQLHLAGTASCNLRAVDTDDGAVNQVLAALLEGLAPAENFTVEKVVDERRDTNGGEEHLVGYRLTWKAAGVSANLGVSHIAGDGKDIPPQVNFMLALRQTI